MEICLSLSQIKCNNEKKIPQFFRVKTSGGLYLEISRCDHLLCSSLPFFHAVIAGIHVRHLFRPPHQPPLNMPHFVHVKTGALQGHKLKPGDKNITAVSAGRKRIRMLQIGPFRILTGQRHESHAASLSATERIPLKWLDEAQFGDAASSVGGERQKSNAYP